MTPEPPPATVDLRLYPALARAALDYGTERQFLVWSFAKASVAAGRFGSQGPRESLPAERFVQVVAEAANRSRSTVRKILSAGEGTFWSTDRRRQRVFLPGPDLLARRLKLDHAGRSVRRVTVSGRLGVAEWRALLMAPLLPVRPTRLSRQTVAERTSVSARTQRRWEHGGVVAYHDGQGRPPVRSAAIYGSFNLALPQHPELGRMSPRAALSQECRDGRPLASAGFFTDKRGHRLLRQGPKQFCFTADRVRRKPRRHRHGRGDTPAREPGNREPNPAVPMVSWQPRPPRGSRIAMQGRGSVREAVPLGPDVTVLDLRFGKPL